MGGPRGLYDPRNRSEMMFYDAHSGATVFLDVISLEDRANQSHIGDGSAPDNRDSEGFVWARGWDHGSGPAKSHIKGK